MKHATCFAATMALTLLALGCSGNKESQPTNLPSQTLLPENSRPSEVRPAPPPKPPEDTLIVIEPGAEEDPRRGLIEASKAERSRREEAGEPTVVLTDKNLDEYQEGAQLTFVHEDGQTAPPADDSSLEATGNLPSTEVGEQYWRDRGRQIRTGWRDAIDRIESLQTDIAEYRRRFYEEDDPSVRDTLIKPAWDRAMEELTEARTEARELESDLQSYLDLGYESGAYDEWLEEGIELEPTSEELEELERARNTIQFDEPDIAAEDLDDGNDP